MNLPNRAYKFSFSVFFSFNELFKFFGFVSTLCIFFANFLKDSFYCLLNMINQWIIPSIFYYCSLLRSLFFYYCSLLRSFFFTTVLFFVRFFSISNSSRSVEGVLLGLCANFLALGKVTGFLWKFFVGLSEVLV